VRHEDAVRLAELLESQGQGTAAAAVRRVVEEEANAKSSTPNSKP